jgi:metal-responsive CopG/Arc/MetJ family transcriptional regulator
MTFLMTKSVSVRVDERLIEAVDQVCRREGCDRSEIVREALDLWLRGRKLAEDVGRHEAGYLQHPVSPEEFEPVLGASQRPK